MYYNQLGHLGHVAIIKETNQQTYRDKLEHITLLLYSIG